MRKSILLIGLLLVLLMGISMVSADDSTPKPGTPADNECYPGGVLYREENQDGCPTLWYWKAGWFLARYNRGFISRADFPIEFVSVLPPEENSDGSVCWPSAAGNYSVRYTGPANKLGNVVAFNTSNCTGTSLPRPQSAAIFANSIGDAQTVCNSLITPNLVEKLSPLYYPTAPDNAYSCDGL